MTTLTLEINPKRQKEILTALKLIRGIKNIALSDSPKKAPPAWLLEADEMKKHPERYRRYSNLDEMFADLDK